MKKLLLLPFLVFAFFTSFAQQAVEPCGFDQIHNSKLKNDAEYRMQVEQFEKSIQKYYQSAQNNRTNKAGVITIPIVFHVLHHGEAVGTKHNLSDAQIESAVRGLNVYYRNNKNWPALPAVPINANGVDQNIEFCLAKRNPAGQPTNGIDRIDGRVYTNYEAQGLTSANESTIITATGWDKNKYYNVFVVSEINDQGGGGSGNVGNANFPPGPGGTVPTNDRTVVIWKSCGYIAAGENPPYKNTSLVAPYDNNTMVHEMGHAFSLYHTFANDSGDLANQGGGTGQPASACGTAETAANCATRGDRVCDTDRHLGNLGSCPTAGSTMNECTGTPYNVNIASNIMNYTNCSPGLFTAGQRDRIAGALSSNTVRKNLAASDACNSVFPYDLALTSLLAPSGFQCNGSVTPKLVVKNTGQNAITSFELVYGVDGAFNNTYTWTGNLASNTETTVTANVFTVPIGAHSFGIKVVNSTININQADGFAANDQLSGAVEVIDGTLLSLDASEYATDDYLEFRNAGTTTVVAKVMFDDPAGTMSKAVCVPNKCLDIILVDKAYNPTNPVVGGVPSGLPKFSLKDDKGFEVIKGFTAAAFAAPNPGFNSGFGAERTETFKNLCFPYDPGYLTADFKADQLVVLVGTAIQFTDLSSAVKAGAPAANKWTWTFGDGATSAVKNPVKSYATPGVYEVKLTVENGTQPSSETKTNYIRVIAPLTGCDNFDNLLPSEVPNVVNDPNGLGGYYPGPNGAGVVSYAEKFWTPSASTLKSIDVYTGYKVVANPNTMVTFTVYADGAGLPATVLGFKKFPLNDLTTGNYTNIQFDSPVSVNSYYFVGVQVDLPAGDTIVIGASPYRLEKYSNTAYLLLNSLWRKSTDFLVGSSSHALGLKANLSVTPKSVINSDVTQICLGKNILFNANSSKFATGGFQWIFEGGSPATSTLATPSVSFTSQGVKNITLIAKGGCNETDTIRTTIKVNDQLSVDITGVEESCNRGNGMATAAPVGGSGDYSYKWNTSPQQTTVIANNLSAGSYTLTLTDAKCGVVTKSVIINNVNNVPDFGIDIANTSCGLTNGSATVQAIGVAAPAYKWTDASGNVISTNKTISAVGAGLYKIQVSDPGCQPNEKTIEIMASSGLTADVSQSVTSLCKGSTVTFVATGGDKYVWNNGVSDIAFTDTLIVAPATTTNYKVKISTTNGCFVELTREIIVTLNPSAIAGVNNEDVGNYDSIAIVDICKNEVAFFSSAGSIGASYTWDFGDSLFSNVKNPFHRYAKTGVYTVVLKVKIDGCITSDTVYVNAVCTTGLNELEVNTFSIYPNPSTGKINIESLKGLAIEKVSLVDALGRTASLVYTNSQVNLEAYANGIYTLVIQTKQGSQAIRVELNK